MRHLPRRANDAVGVVVPVECTRIKTGGQTEHEGIPQGLVQMQLGGNGEDMVVVEGEAEDVVEGTGLYAIHLATHQV